MNFYLPITNKQSVIDEACWEKIAKLTPSSASDAPSGKAIPAEHFNGRSGEETFSCYGMANIISNLQKVLLLHTVKVK